MKPKRAIGVGFAFALLPIVVAVTPASAISAAGLTEPDLAALVQSTANDTDMILLSYLTSPPSSLSYVYNSTASDATWTSWSGALSGTFSGQPLSLPYNNGTLTDYPPGTVSWNTLGSLAGGAVSGGGSGTISYPTSSTFDLSFMDSLSYQGVTATADLSIPGTILGPGNFMFGTPGNPEATADGSITLSDPIVITILGKYSYFKIDDVYFDDTVWRIGPRRYLIRINSYLYFTGDGTGVGNRGILVPEPSTWAMVLLGFAGLGYVGWRRGGKPQSYALAA
jgi:hypothetical protein